ncbi:MAG: hypothetical protein ACI8QZ_002690 [Chlamydiales bacterium]|jgi:hypothetical protein
MRTTRPATRLPIAATLIALALAGPHPTANAATTSSPLAARPSADEPVERLSAWPKVESKTNTNKEISRLRKARTEEMGTESAQVLIDTGAAVVPLLIKSLDKEKGEEARERILGVLDSICGPAHTRLLAQEFQHRSPVVRRWALTKVAATPDTGVREAAEAALGKLLESAEEGREPAAERFAAALCATSTGSLAGLDVLYAEALRDWPGNGHAIRLALEAVRGPQAAARYWGSVHTGSRKEKIATLRMLAGCGEKEGARKLSSMLDDTDNGIRVAAINALRGIVDGEPPLVKLATFAAIEKALKWKARL